MWYYYYDYIICICFMIMILILLYKIRSPKLYLICIKVYVSFPEHHIKGIIGEVER